MGQINNRLRSVEGHHFAHYCDGCEMMHGVPTSWTFNGDFASPTVTPSMHITGWQREGPIGGQQDGVCHYVMTAGIITYCSDCTHKLAGQVVPIPELPKWVCDFWDGTV